MTKRSSWSQFRHIMSGIFVVLLVILAVAFVSIRLLGFTPYVVLSGSMEPAYPVGSLIFVKSVEPESVDPGDAITFVLNKELQVVTHRVVEVDRNEGYYRTKGDANASIDGRPVNYNNLIGKPVFLIPRLGYIIHYLSQCRALRSLIVGILCVLLLLSFVNRRERASLKDNNQTVKQ